MSVNCRDRNIERLGSAHPQMDLSCGLAVNSNGKNGIDLMKDWLQWLIGLPTDNNPLLHEYDPFTDNNQSRRTGSPLGKPVKGVLFLAPSNYAAGGAEYYRNYLVVPLGEWHIFFCPYIIFNSTLEYPSRTEQELYDSAKRQVDSVYKLEASVDGISTECFRVPIEPKDAVEIKGIPDKNVLGIGAEEISSDGSLRIVGDGYGCCLNPLPAGLHTLNFKGYSPSYSVDTQFTLNVRGPSTKPGVQNTQST